MCFVKTAEDLGKISIACQICRQIILRLISIIREGLTTADINYEAERLMRQYEVKPAFKGYRKYPCAVCVSVNEEVVHGIPSVHKKLSQGDIVSIDLGIIYDGYYGDCADTVGVGKIHPRHQLLIDTAYEALRSGIRQAIAGNRVGDISAAIQSTVEARKFSVVREFSGHGIGKNLHEPPEVPNFGRPGQGESLIENMVLAIEPMVNEGKAGIRIAEDGWTAVTVDGSWSAHCEETVLVFPGKAKVLTSI
ncbi:MAG: type I methionyl aminopeptidase [Candidatus Omnitrophica bacterium]|nr:type I methionyl aminopeptidase [Candidatus Omnitrophota bacterium]